MEKSANFVLTFLFIRITMIPDEKFYKYAHHYKTDICTKERNRNV